jgi:uncharacterized protein
MIFFENFETSAQLFLSQMVSDLETVGMAELAPQIDHFCLRVATVARYEEWKTYLEEMGVLLAETEVNGRPIATYKLHKSLLGKGNLVANTAVAVIELPSPKSNVDYPEGFEHVEIVVPSLEELASTFANQFETSFVKSSASAKPIKELKLKLKSGLVKFHERSLEEIIDQELRELTSK